MTTPIIIMCVGIVIMILSFFISDRTKKIEKEVEDLSINIYQETNALKRRLKIVEEELLVDPSFKVQSSSPIQPIGQHAAAVKKTPMETFQQVAAQVQAQKAAQPTYTPPMKPVQPTSDSKPVHSIIVNQVLELNKQGLSIEEISQRSTLSHDQIHSILLQNGGL